VTLPRLLLAWLAVGIWFLAARWAARRWILRADAAFPPWAPGAGPARAIALEAAGATLFASLWFDSLGHGGWWLLFLLVGLLVAFAPRIADSSPTTPLPRRTRLLAGVADVARYVGAGAVLAWRLG
jgi:hypothetical protein